MDEGGGGLKVDIYKANNAEPMMAAGYIYEDKKSLAGQIFSMRNGQGGCGAIKKAWVYCNRRKRRGVQICRHTNGVFSG